MILLAQSLDGLRDGGIRVPGKIHSPGPALQERFSQLFGTHNDPFSGLWHQIAAFRDLTIFLCVHTSYYYTHFSGIVNINSRKNSDFFLHLIYDAGKKIVFLLFSLL